MSTLSCTAVRGALMGLAVLIGAANGPANAALVPNTLTANSLTANALTSNSLTANALNSNSLTSNSLTSNALFTNAMSHGAVDPKGLDDLNGVTIETAGPLTDAVR